MSKSVKRFSLPSPSDGDAHVAVQMANAERGYELHLPRTGIFRILICRVTHSLGNTLCVTPLVRALEQIYPGAEIDVLTRSPVANEVFGGFAAVRRIFRLPAHGASHLIKYGSTLRAVRSTNYDLVIDPSVGSGTDRAWTAAAHARLKVGFVKDRFDRVLTHAVEADLNTKHAAMLPVVLLRAALGIDLHRPFPNLDIALSAHERAEGRRTLARLVGEHRVSEQPVLGIFANATGTKRLPQEWWKSFLSALERRFPDVPIVEFVPAFGQSMLDARYPAYYSSDIRRLASTLSALTKFITADCGVMHLACAAQTPVTALFHATDPEEWGPYGPQDVVLDARLHPPEIMATRILLPK